MVRRRSEKSMTPRKKTSGDCWWGFAGARGGRLRGGREREREKEDLLITTGCPV
jgi:hypothetical protein